MFGCGMVGGLRGSNWLWKHGDSRGLVSIRRETKFQRKDMAMKISLMYDRIFVERVAFV